MPMLDVGPSTYQRTTRHPSLKKLQRLDGWADQQLNFTSEHKNNHSPTDEFCIEQSENYTIQP